MLCAWKHIKVNLRQCAGVSCQGTILFLVVLMLFTGCGKRKEAVVLEEVYSNRANDKIYIASLMTNRQQQAKEAQSRHALSLKMTQCVSRVRGALPADASEESLTKALATDQEWSSLTGQVSRAEATANATLQEAQNLIRKRMQEEVRANQAIAQGKAKAMDGVPAAKTVGKK